MNCAAAISLRPTSRQVQAPIEAIALFEMQDDFQDAVGDLLTHGFDHSDISLLAGEQKARQTLHHGYGKIRLMEDDPAAPRTEYVSIETIGDAEGALIGVPLYVGAVVGVGIAAASGATLVAAVMWAAAAGGGGALVGWIMARWLDRRHAQYIKRQIDAGGIPLWVRIRSPEHDCRAVDILSRHAGKDVHVHRSAG